MEEVSFPIEQDRKEEGDHHDGRSDHRDPSTRDEGIEDDAGDREPRCTFFNVQCEEKKFGTL